MNPNPEYHYCPIKFSLVLEKIIVFKALYYYSWKHLRIVLGEMVFWKETLTFEDKNSCSLIETIYFQKFILKVFFLMCVDFLNFISIFIKCYELKNQN